MPSSRARISRGWRIRKRAEFQKIYRCGERASGRFFTIFAVTQSVDDDSTNSRFGVTATKKVGGAVERARCRRRLRELFRLRFREKEIRFLDLVLHARGGCGTAPWQILERDFDRCLSTVRSRLE